MLNALLRDIVASLPAGKTLFDVHPQAFAAPAPAAAGAAPSPVHSVSVTQHATTSSAVPAPIPAFLPDVAISRSSSPVLPVLSAAPSPTLSVLSMAPSCPASLSPSGGSPVPVASPLVDLVSSSPLSAASGVDAAPLVSSLPAPSPPVGSPHPKRAGPSSPAVAILGRIAPVLIFFSTSLLSAHFAFLVRPLPRQKEGVRCFHC